MTKHAERRATERGISKKCSGGKGMWYVKNGDTHALLSGPKTNPTVVTVYRGGKLKPPKPSKREWRPYRAEIRDPPARVDGRRKKSRGKKATLADFINFGLNDGEN